MKKIILLLFSVIALNAMSATQPVTIPNGDMSQWDFLSGSTTEYDTLPRNFGAGGNVTNFKKYLSKSTETYQGMNALQMTYGGSQANVSYFITPYFNLTTGIYKLSFYVKGNGYFRTVNLCTDDVPEVNRRSGQTSSLQAGGTTYISRPMGTSSGAQAIADWTEFTYTFTVTTPGNYSLNFAHNNGTTGNVFLVSNITMSREIEYNSDCSLQKILLSATGYTKGGPESLPGFDPETLDYTVDLSFNYTGGVPVASAYPSQYESVEVVETATSLSGSNNVTKIKVTSSDGTVSKTYNITFKQTKDFISGCFTDFKSSPVVDFEITPGAPAVYSNEKTANHGLYWGDNGTRPNSNGVFDLVTPQLINGMGTISFYVKDYVNVPTQDDNSSALVVRYKMKSSDPWTRIDSIPAADITDAMGWVYKSYIMNKELVADIDTPQVSFYIYRAVTTGGPRDFVLDDFRITSYSGTSIKDSPFKENGLKVYSGIQAVMIEQEGSGFYQLYTSTGQLVSSGYFSDKATVPVKYSGLYIVKVGTKSKKVVIK